MSRYLSSKVITIAEPLYLAIPVMFGIHQKEWEQMYTDKEGKSDKLYGMSPREAMQWLAEDVLKPTFGPAHLGNVAAEKASLAACDGIGLVIVSDGGFVEEMQSFVDKLGNKNCVILQVIRYEEPSQIDTRIMLGKDDLDVEQHTIYNTGSIFSFFSELTRVAEVII